MCLPVDQRPACECLRPAINVTLAQLKSQWAAGQQCSCVVEVTWHLWACAVSFAELTGASLVHKNICETTPQAQGVTCPGKTYMTHCGCTTTTAAQRALVKICGKAFCLHLGSCSPSSSTAALLTQQRSSFRCGCLFASILDTNPIMGMPDKFVCIKSGGVHLKFP